MRITILLTIFALFFSAAPAKKKIRVAVAANAQFVMQEIETLYEKENGVDLELVVGSSGKLCAQIREGAPVDVFLSADTTYPHTLFKEGLCQEKPSVYACGVLVLWAHSSVKPLSIKSLLKPEVNSIAIANAKLAPYGSAAISAMQHASVYETVKSKLVYGESIAQVNQYITTNTVEAGFTAKSVVLSTEWKAGNNWIEVDRSSYPHLAQSVALLNENPDAVKFYQFLLSKKAKEVFKKFGYQVK